MFTVVSCYFFESEVPKNIILNRVMISISAFSQTCHYFYGIGGPTKTVFGSILNLKINQGAHQSFKTNARNLHLSKIVIKRDISAKSKYLSNSIVLDLTGAFL